MSRAVSANLPAPNSATATPTVVATASASATPSWELPQNARDRRGRQGCRHNLQFCAETLANHAAVSLRPRKPAGPRASAMMRSMARSHSMLARGFSSSAPAAKKIQLYDTTLRDGTQGEGVSLSLHDKLAISERLDDNGFDFIEGGYPLSNEKDVAFFEQARSQRLTPLSAATVNATSRTPLSAASVLTDCAFDSCDRSSLSTCAARPCAPLA